MPDPKELSRDDKRRIRDERRDKKQHSTEDPHPDESKPSKPPPTALKMTTKTSTTSSSAPTTPPKSSHPMPVLPLHLRPQPARAHMENVPYFSVTGPDEEQDSTGHGEGGVSKGKYCQYAEQVRKASVPRSADIPHSVNETKESLKEELQRLANIPKYIETEEQTEILSHVPKLENRVSKYNLALEGVRLDDSGSDTDTQAQDEEDQEIMSPNEPLPKIRERYLSLASGEVILNDNGKLVPRERTESDLELLETISLEDRKSSYDKALEQLDIVDVERDVTRPHSPLPKIRERYLDVARGLTEPKPEDPEVVAHREALMQQLRESDKQRKFTEDTRRELYIKEKDYHESRRKEEAKEMPPKVPVKAVKQEYLQRAEAPPKMLHEEETVLAKPSTPVNAIKSQLAAAASKTIEPRYHGIDPVTQEILSSDIDQAPLPGYNVLKWRYAPKEEVKSSPVQKPKLKAMDELSWVAVDAVERQPKEPAWKECLELLNLRVTEEMKTPTPQYPQ